MDFNEYQRHSQETDQKPGGDDDALIVPLLGLVGEAGTLQSEFKKRLRDGDAHARFTEQVAEELGDILWYVSNLAFKVHPQTYQLTTTQGLVQPYTYSDMTGAGLGLVTHPPQG